MANQLLVNQFPYGRNTTQQWEELSGSVILAGSAVSTGEPLNWGNLYAGIGYNEFNFAGNGINGQGAALVTALTASGSGSTAIITCTSANNFVVGASVTFQFCTTTLGKKLNGLTFAVTASTPGTSFVISSTLTGSGSGEVGMAVTNTPSYPLIGTSKSGTLTATITSLSLTSGILTVTAANTFLPGALVTFAGLSTVLGLLLNGVSLTVLSSTGTAFTVATTLTGTNGTDAGTASGINPQQPFSVQFWSNLASGYVYQYNGTYGTLFVQETATVTPSLSIGAGTPATYPVGTTANSGSTTLVATGAVTIPLTATTAAALGNLGAGAYPAGVLGDVIKY